MTRKFLSKWFKKWTRKSKITDQMLLQAYDDLVEGKATVSLGANLFKVRVAIAGHGKSGGFRTLVMYKEDTRCVFFVGFAKKDLKNLTEIEVKELKLLSETYIGLSEKEFDLLVSQGRFFEFEGK